MMIKVVKPPSSSTFDCVHPLVLGKERPECPLQEHAKGFSQKLLDKIAWIHFHLDTDLVAGPKEDSYLGMV